MKMHTIALVGPANYHHGEITPVIQAEVVDWRLELFLVLVEPAREVERWSDGHRATL